MKIDILSTRKVVMHLLMKSECCGCAKNLAVCCFSLEIRREYEARRFRLEGIGSRHGRGTHEKKTHVWKSKLRTFMIVFLVCFWPTF